MHYYKIFAESCCCGRFKLLLCFRFSKLPRLYQSKFSSSLVLAQEIRVIPRSRVEQTMGARQNSAHLRIFSILMAPAAEVEEVDAELRSVFRCTRDVLEAESGIVDSWARGT
jgi:hypothetical protein